MPPEEKDATAVAPADAENTEAEAAAAPAAPPAEEAPAADAAPAPVIIIKKIIDDGHGGAHGGAWKIALADMMTAMMAFFLLMWLLGASNEDQRKSIADYFKPTSQSLVAIGQLAGSNGILGGRSIIDPDGFPFAAKQTALLERLTPRSEGGPNPSTDPGQENENPYSDPDKLTPEQKKEVAAAQEKADFAKLEKEIEQKLSQNKKLEGLKDQVSVTRDKQGLRIEIIDKADFAMFPSGSMSMQGKASNLIAEIAASLADMPNKVAIRGHTDSVPFQSKEGRNNWSLSAERAEATRQILEKNGIKENRFARIEGVADTDPFNPKDPRDPRNRRMSITVLYQDQD
ncbi:MAG: Motility protein [Pseudomonadota bacterium]|jgi:chemotaxis protein MotB